jgi:hypothetical protein
LIDWPWGTFGGIRKLGNSLRDELCGNLIGHESPVHPTLLERRIEEQIPVLAGVLSTLPRP